MAASKKRRKLPEEDLEAAVADIINSPITRPNLSFLRPPAGAADEASKPVGDGPTPSGLNAGAAIAAAPAAILSEEATPMGVGDVGVVDGEPPAAPMTLWQAPELAAVFGPRRVSRIRQAEDALSRAERKVYDLLWGPANSAPGEYRLVHYSLQRVAAEAEMNIKTVRELIPRLIEKGFLRIEHEADVRRNLPTLYRVMGGAAVLDDQRRRQRLYVVKTGKGVFYVHPVTATLDPMVDLMAAPQGASHGCIPGGDSPQPGGDGTKPEGYDPKPMGVKSELSALSTRVGAAIRESLGIQPPDTLVAEMIAACQQNAVAATGEAATAEELIYFASTKAGAIARASNIRNHLAVLRKSVPECFSGESFRAYRTAARRRAAG